MLYTLPDTVCGAQRIPYLLTAGIPDTDQCYAIWCEAENTTLAGKAFLTKPSDVFFHGLLQHPTNRHQVIILTTLNMLTKRKVKYSWPVYTCILKLQVQQIRDGK
jgi:hypothetical protein